MTSGIRRVDILETISATDFLQSVLPFAVHLREWRKPYWGPLGCPEREKRDYFKAWVSGA